MHGFSYVRPADQEQRVQLEAQWQHVLVAPGDAPARGGAVDAFLSEGPHYARGIPGVREASAGLCPPDEPDPTTPCITIRVDRCTGPTLDVLALHASRWAKAFELEGSRFLVVLLVSGASGPHCVPGDPHHPCLPDSYHPNAPVRYDPDGLRIPYDSVFGGDQHDPDVHPCTHDGDCAVMGKQCESWVEGYYPRQVTAEWATYLEGKLCGCVAGHCSWFTQ